MTPPLPIITQPPPGARNRAGFYLRERRFASAGILAAAEALYVLVSGPGMFLATLVAMGILVGAIALWNRTGPGLWSDVLLVVAMAQGLVLLIPLFLIGFSIAIALTLFAVIVVGLAIAVSAARR